MKLFEQNAVNQLTTRQLQLLAAICLVQYCRHFRIECESVRELVCHLCLMSSAENLAEWEQKGTLLDISGRGDTLPESVLSTLPSDRLGQFNELLESVVEVGLVDMYGAVTDQPKSFLLRCFDILRQAKVELPALGPIHLIDQNESGWGEPVSKEDLLAVLESYELDC